MEERKYMLSIKNNLKSSSLNSNLKTKLDKQEITLNNRNSNSLIINRLTKDEVSFAGIYVNNNYYTDLEYSDAIKYKKEKEGAKLYHIGERYNFFEYWFTAKAEKHVAEVNKCIKDIKIQEEKDLKQLKEKQENEKLLAKQKEEQRRLLEEKEKEQKLLQEELERTIKENQKLELERKKINESSSKLTPREEAIVKLTQIPPYKTLAKLKQDTIDLIITSFIKPFATDKIDKNEGLSTKVPNGVLLHSPYSTNNQNIAKALAEQVLQDKFHTHFKEVSMKNNNYYEFEETLENIKEQALTDYDDNDQRTIIFIKDFDKIALTEDNKEYNSQLNSFLKTFFLDCAESGCTILATATNINDIESPFTINEGRFKAIIPLTRESIINSNPAKMDLNPINNKTDINIKVSLLEEEQKNSDKIDFKKISELSAEIWDYAIANKQPEILKVILKYRTAQERHDLDTIIREKGKPEN
ncbi:MAG: AAA family ATPase [bacterium]